MATCEVSLCTHSDDDAGYIRCFACGNPCCRIDSTIAPKYFRKRNVRICADCIEDRRDDIAAGNITIRRLPAGCTPIKETI